MSHRNHLNPERLDEPGADNRVRVHAAVSAPGHERRGHHMAAVSDHYRVGQVKRVRRSELLAPGSELLDGGHSR